MNKGAVADIIVWSVYREEERAAAEEVDKSREEEAAEEVDKSREEEAAEEEEEEAEEEEAEEEEAERREDKVSLSAIKYYSNLMIYYSAHKHYNNYINSIIIII